MKTPCFRTLVSVLAVTGSLAGLTAGGSPAAAARLTPGLTPVAPSGPTVVNIVNTDPFVSYGTISPFVSYGTIDPFVSYGTIDPFVSY